MQETQQKRVLKSQEFDLEGNAERFAGVILLLRGKSTSSISARVTIAQKQPSYMMKLFISNTEGADMKKGSYSIVSSFPQLFRHTNTKNKVECTEPPNDSLQDPSKRISCR
jgi:hypothetical protein